MEDWVAETLLTIYPNSPICNVCFAKMLGMSEGGISRRTEILEKNGLIISTGLPCYVCGKTYSLTWALTKKGVNWLKRAGYKLNPPPAAPVELYAKTGWKARMPKTINERRQILQTYGKTAFLDPTGLRYPVVNMNGEYDCMGILAAYRRARQFHESKIANKAWKLGEKVGCEWTLRGKYKRNPYYSENIKLPKYANINFALSHILQYGYLDYLTYKPRGRAASYISSYNKIWDNLDKYARKAGFNIRYIPGPKGGRWTSKWVLID